MLRRFNFTIGHKIYAVIALSFAVFLGITAFEMQQLKLGLEDQKRVELKHLGEVAIAVVKEEYAAAQSGAVSADEAKQRAAKRVGALRYGDNDYYFISDMNLRMVAHPLRPEMIGRDLSDFKDANGKRFYVEFVDVVRRDGKGFVSYDQLKPGVKEPQPKLSYVEGFVPWGWVIATGVYVDSLQQQVWDIARRALLITAISLLLAGAVSVVVARRMSQALRNMTGAMAKLASGNLDVVLPGLGRRDEIGAMAEAVESFKAKAVEQAHLASEQEDAKARAAAAARKAELHDLAAVFESAVGKIVASVSSASNELEAAASKLTHAAETSQQLATVVAGASEAASSNVQSVASATEEMTSSVDEIARQVQESSRITGEAVKQAERTDARINELSQAASRIGDVVKLITAIAEQTNLLALNATIEAARAGDAGRGFAVVASEVKSLAMQTAKATEEIGTQIAGMQAATNDSVAAIKEISATIGRTSEIASTIAAAVEEQGAATQEISRNVQHAAQGTAQVASNITDVNRGASETGAASAQVLSSARSLSSESNHLKLEVEKFLNTIRAA